VLLVPCAPLPQIVRLELSGNAEGSWSATASAPWNSPKDLDVAVGRTFGLSGLADLSFPNFGNN